MNDYMQVRFDVEPCSEMATDVLAAVLAEIGYESLSPTNEGLLLLSLRVSMTRHDLKKSCRNIPSEGYL